MIVSNCVINLSVDKLAVLRGALELLKPGGELYFADVYCDRRLPDGVQGRSRALWRMPRRRALLERFPADGQASRLPRSAARDQQADRRSRTRRCGRSSARRKFFSATYRLFKLDGLETACEDYGQAVIYKGSVAEQPDAFELDGHHLIERGKVFPVCGNTWRMLADTRFEPAFRFHRRLLHTLRHLPRLRHVDPIRHELGVGSEIGRRLLLDLRPSDRHDGRSAGIHKLDHEVKDVDGRDKPGHDGEVRGQGDNAIRSDAPLGGRSARHVLSGDGGGRLYPAAVGEEQRPVVGVGREQVLDGVLLAGDMADDPLAAAMLAAVGRDRLALDVAAAG